MIRALVAVAAAACLVAPSAPAAAPPNAADLEAELVCPVCETTLDQSNAPVAERLKAGEVRIAPRGSRRSVRVLCAAARQRSVRDLRLDDEHEADDAESGKNGGADGVHETS